MKLRYTKLLIGTEMLFWLAILRPRRHPGFMAAFRDLPQHLLTNSILLNIVRPPAALDASRNERLARGVSVNYTSVNLVVRR